MWTCIQCAEGNGESTSECWKCGRVHRRDPRIRIDWHTHWGITKECLNADRITSLSLGGCFLQTGKVVPRGKLMYVRLDLPNSSVVRGEVRYHLEDVGLGVQFAGLSDTDKDSLRMLLNDFEALQA